MKSAEELSNKFISAIAQNRLLGLGELKFEEIDDSIEYAREQNLSWLLLEIYANLVLRGKNEYLKEIKEIINKSENMITNYKVKLRLRNIDTEFKKESEKIINELNVSAESINLHFNPKIYEEI